MMREFQAENDRHQITIENNLTALINATAEHVNITSTSNNDSPSSSVKQQETSDNNSNPTGANLNASERRPTIGDQNKSNIKTINRLTSDSFKVSYYFIFEFFYMLDFRHQDVR
jgi:hypothetical protein